MRFPITYFHFLICHTLWSVSSLNLHRPTQSGNSIFNFLLLRDVFYECSKPVVLDTHQMQITTLKQLNEYCISDSDQCIYYEWNPEIGTAYICSSSDFIKAQPRLGWFIGIKPSILSEDEQFDSLPNIQAICDKELQRHTVSSIKEAIQECKKLGCGSMTINLNKAEALGPSLAPLTTWYCTDMVSSAARNGFLTLNHMENGSVNQTPTLPTGIRVPCGMNGPVCSNDYVDGHQQGDILSDRFSTLQS